MPTNYTLHNTILLNRNVTVHYTTRQKQRHCDEFHLVLSDLVSTLANVHYKILSKSFAIRVLAHRIRERTDVHAP